MAKTKVTGGYIADSAITSDHLHTTLDLSTKTLTIGAATVSGHLIPDTNITYDLGSSTNRFRDIYLDGSTINLGGTELKKNDAGDIELKSGSTFKKLVISELEFNDGTNRKKFKIDSGRVQAFDASGVSDAADKISLAANNTDDLGEGSSNLYFTTARARGAISASTGIAITDGAISAAAVPNASLTNSSITINSNSLSLGGTLTLDTDDIGEGSTNLYFTNARARGAISVSGNALSYNSSTGVLTANYEESPSFTGNITVSGTVDGRDIAADGTKLDGIESGATADQTQSDINALGITATGLSGTPNITVGTISSGAITAGTFVSATDYMRVTDTGNAKNILLGNQNSGGVNKPAIIQGVNGRLRLGHGSSWTTSGGTFTTAIDLENNNLDISTGALLMGSTTVIDSSRNLTNIGTISSGAITSSGVIAAGAVARMYTSSDRGYFVAGTNDSSNQHLYLGSYHGTTLKELTFSGSNNAFYPQTSEAIDLGLSTKKFKNLQLSGTISSGAITSSGVITVNNTAIDKKISFNRTGGKNISIEHDTNQIYFWNNTDSNFLIKMSNTGLVQSKIGFGVDGTTVIDSSRNLTNIGTISSGAITSSGDIFSTGNIAASGYLQAYSFLYTRDNLRVLNTAGTGWNTWGTRSNGNYNLNVGTVQATSFSDGTISGVTFIDEDSFSTNSATRVPTQQSIKAYVDAQVAGVVDTAPSALNTLNELAAALGDDANFSTTTSTALGNRLRVDTAAQGLTGTQQANAITNLGITATKAELNFVDGVTSNIQTQLNGKQASGSYLTGNQTITLSGDVSGSGTTSIAVTVADDSHTHDGRYFTETEADARFINVTGDTATGIHEVDGRWHFNPSTNSSYREGIRLNRSTTDWGGAVFGGVRDSIDGITEAWWVARNPSKNLVLSYGTSVDSGGLLLTHNNTTMKYKNQRVFMDDYHPNADTLTTARTINGVSFNGSANITVADATKLPLAGGTMTGGLNVTNNSSITIGTFNTTDTGTLVLTGSTANKQSVLKCTNGNLHIDAASGNTMYLNFYSGTGFAFGNGATAVAAWMGSDGDLWKGSADNTGSKYWHAGNDGSGSGLDADTVDSLQASSFLRSDALTYSSNNIGRANHHLGHLVGAYNNVGGNSANPNPIYSIGTSYLPTATNLSSFYGIGFAHPNLWGSGKTAGWGLYAADAGNVTFTAGYSAGTSGIGVWSQGNFVSTPQGTLWGSSNDGSGSGLDADTVDALQRTNIREINSEYSATVSSDGWYTIAEYGSGRGQGEFYIYDIDSSRHNFVKIDASWSYGNGGITCTANGKHGVLTIQHARLLYNTSDQTYGGCKLQIYCANAAWTLRVRQMPSQMSGWGAFTQVTPVLANSVTNFALYSQAHNLALNGGFSTSGSSWWAGGNLVWNSGNDGAGSGLDADLLDGQQGSYYAPASGANYVPSGGGWMGVNFSGSRHSGLGVNGGEIAFIRDHPNNAQMSVLVDGEFYAGENNGFYSLYSGNSYNSKVGFYGNSSGHFYITTTNVKANGNTIWHAGNDGSGSGLDADTVDGKHKDYLMHYKGLVSGNWDTIFSQTGGHMGVYEVHNLASGHSNHPTGVYTYGGVMSWQLDNSTFKLYSSHTGDLVFQSGWNNDEYSGWRRILNTSYYGAAWTSENDSSGSGLDADLLDGQEGSYYLNYNNLTNKPSLATLGYTGATNANYITNNNQLTNGAGYTTQGTVNASNVTGLAITGLGTNNLSYGQTSGSLNGYTGWASHFIGNHGAGATYYMQDIIMPFWNAPKYSRRQGTTTVVGPYDFWTSENDGSNSGLDADLLDGQEGAYYLTASNFTGTLNDDRLPNFVHLGTATTTGYATDDGNWGSRLNVSSNIHAKIEVSQEANSMRSHWYAHTGQDNIKFGTSTSHDVEIQRGGTTRIEAQSDGANITGNFRVSGTTVIDASRNLTNIGRITMTSYNQPILLNASGTGSAGSAMGFQQATAEGWSGIFVDFNPNEGWGLYHDNPSNYFYITAETTTGSLGTSFTVPNRGSGSSTAYAKIRFDQNNGNINAGGEITANGNITAYASDKRLKTNFRPIEKALDKVKQLNGLIFDWNEVAETNGFIPDTKTDDMGLIAQEVQKVAPQAVDLAPFDTEITSTPHDISDKNAGNIEEKKSISGNNYLTVKYDKLVPLLVEAIKEQQETINKLTRRLDDIEKGE